MPNISTCVHDFLHDGFGVSLELNDQAAPTGVAEARWKEIYDLFGKEIVDYNAEQGLVIFWDKFEEARKEDPYECGQRFSSYVEIILGLEAISHTARRKNYLENRNVQYFAIVDSAGAFIGPKLNGKPIFFYTVLVAKSYARAVKMTEGYRVVVADKVLRKRKEDTS